MRRLVLLSLIGGASPLLAHAQAAQTSGIRFEQGLSWSAVRAKAKAANKPIFLVLATSSCEPCTQLEQYVYTRASVGAYLNDRFVSVKVQVDTTPRDGADGQRWAAEARKIRQQYAVTVFPTFLFFSPTGKLLHRAEGTGGFGSGGRDTLALLALAVDALNPAKQYYTLRDQFQRGAAELTLVRDLAQMARTLKDTAVAQQAARAYLTRLSDSARYTPENLTFASIFTRRSEDPGFPLFYRHAAKVDSVLGVEGASRGVVHHVITLEEIRPRVVRAERGGSAPDWDGITAAIAQKYGAEYADQPVIGAKVAWYKAQRDWPNYVASLVTQVERYGPKKVDGFMAVIGLNNSAWEVFLYGSDQAALTRALAWSERVMKVSPTANHFDTYANLLYKLGRTEEALRWQEVVVKLAPGDQDFATNLEKMKKGEPTWPQH